MPLNKILDGKIQKLWDGFPSQLQGEAEQRPLKMAFVASGSHMYYVPGSWESCYVNTQTTFKYTG